MLPFALLLALLPFTVRAGLDVPEIRLNSSMLKKTEVVLLPGTHFSLSCLGQAKVVWRTRVNNIIRKSRNILTVNSATADHTGTYRCSYENHTELFSELHIFVKDPAKFFTRSLTRVIVEREGSSCLLDCRPTDPKATAFSLRSADGSPVHPKLNYTADPRQGILIRDLQPSYSGDYTCSVSVNETERLSTVYSIVVQERVRPPSVFIEMDEYVRIAGETLQITCYTMNQDHTYVVTWHDSSNKMLNGTETVSRSQDLVHIKSVLTIPEVSVSDTGNLTCTGRNRYEENSSTISLTVVDKPYIHLTPVLKLRGRQFGADVDVMEGELLELSVEIDAHPPIQEKWWNFPLTFLFNSYRNVTSLLLRGIRADESGQYIFSARSSSVNVSTRFKIHVYQKPSVVVKMKNGTLTCISTGFPKPTIRWQQCEEFQSTYVLFIYLVSVLSKSNVTGNIVECVAVNSVGENPNKTLEEWGSKMFTTLLSGGSVITALLLVLLGICVYKCKQKPRYEIRWKIIEANDGNNYTYIDPTQLPYNNTRWEFPRDRLTFGQVLGAGAFGKVVEAAAYGLDKDEHVTRVAVKMLKSSALSEEKEALMSELKILSHLGQHANIVNLLGACTQGGPVLLITEYCCHGDLLNFLRRRAELFFSSVLQEPGSPNIYKNLSDHRSQIGRHSVNSYQDMSGSCGGEEVDAQMLDLDDLVRFSTQVAQGLEFLASKNCIHRDVAARNVLVTDCFVAKICDFGLARDIMNDLNYVVRGNARLPVKWMSPESIFECIYTVQSDVWSYGILLWEIFSLGRSPYPDVAVDARFYKMIKAGYHMAQPDFAPPEMYTIMKKCWSLEPTLRPTFGKIVQLIAKLLPESSDQVRNIKKHQLHTTQTLNPNSTPQP
uniref:receptor protein-tyrosine kinase n=1 Tax=Pygocentrus nattereri TaxID=42514 RepID=A0AAR2IH46_PYGNA